MSVCVSTLASVSRSPADLRGAGSLKWTFYEPDVLAAWVAEMDFGLAPGIADALHAAVDRGDTGYFSVVAERASAAATARYWTEELGLAVEPGRVFHAPDVIEGVGRALTHLTEPDTPVIVHTPIYFPFFGLLRQIDRPVIEVACTRDSGGVYRLDIDGLRAAFAAGAGSLILCNPWNPTGRSFTAPELEAVVDVAREHGGRVISDEIHAPLTYPGVTHIPAAVVDPDTVVTVTSASKAWNLPGLKCAQVILTNDRDVEIWSTSFEHYQVGVSNLGLIAAVAAYDQGREWLAEVKRRLAANRAMVTAYVHEELGDVGYSEPEATYLAWLDFSRFGLDDPATFLLAEARVALSSGTPFRGDGRRHARLNFATTPEILAEILERMGSALRPLRR